MNDKHILNLSLRYFIYGLILFACLQFIPLCNIKLSEILMIMIISTTALATLDYIKE